MPAMTIEPTATTVAGDEPETAANSMHASTDAIARPPRKWPMQAIGEADHPLRNAAGGHEGAGQDEERNRQQREVLGGLEQLQRQRGQRVAGRRRRIVSSDDSPSAIAIGMPTSMNANSRTNSAAVVMIAHRPRLRPRLSFSASAASSASARPRSLAGHDAIEKPGRSARSAARSRSAAPGAESTARSAGPAPGCRLRASSRRRSSRRSSR